MAGVLVLGAAAIAQARAGESLPAGFVYLRDLAPNIRQDMRYAGAHNFVGRPIAGYGATECILTLSAAEALAAVQATLAARGLTLLVWDCYRPARAVRQFMRWTRNSDTRMRDEFYPRTNKRELVALGYIAVRSSHSRGSTVDLGIVPATLDTLPSWDGTLKPCTAPKGVRFDDGTIDLGTGFDCFDSAAHAGSTQVPSAAQANRALLREVMSAHGFKPYDREWWHFQLSREPFPDRVFDFPIPTRRPVATPP